MSSGRSRRLNTPPTFSRNGSAPRAARADQETALTLQTYLFGLLNYFGHPITNAISEGFKSKIQAIKADARGFRRFESYRNRILIHCGKLDLRPATP